MNSFIYRSTGRFDGRSGFHWDSICIAPSFFHTLPASDIPRTDCSCQGFQVPSRRIGPDLSGHTLVRFPVQSGRTTGRQLSSNVLSFSLLYSVLKCDLNPSPAPVIQGQVCHPKQSEGSFQKYSPSSFKTRKFYSLSSLDLQ